MDYLTYKVGDVASELKDKNNTLLQRAFGAHLEKVAKALHDIEWVWSGDLGEGDEEEAIEAVLVDVVADKTLDVLKRDATQLMADLMKVVGAADNICKACNKPRRMRDGMLQQLCECYGEVEGL